jgi:hypothetical protein
LPASKNPPSPLAEVPKKVDLLVRQEVLGVVAELLQVFDKPPLTFVQRKWGDLHDFLVNVEKRLVQVQTKEDCLYSAELPRFENALLDLRLEPLELGNELLL